MLSLSDQLANKLEEAINELDIYTVKNKRKKKTKRYEVNSNGDKEEIEETEDCEIIETMKASIDRQGLKFLTAALKDIKDVQSDIGGTEEEYENSGLIDAIKSMGDLMDEDDDSYMLPEEDGEEE